jgi:hypothetical protein
MSVGSGPGRNTGDSGLGVASRQHFSETKPAVKTTEFIVYLAVLAAIVITAFAVGDDGTGRDPFNAEQAVRYITFLTIGYLISRGLAKACSRDRDGSTR